MSKLAATWHDVDGTNTYHDFETVTEAGTWLESVLSEVGGDEDEFEGWAEENGYPTDGFGKLLYYAENDRETVGDITFYRDGSELSPFDLLYEALGLAKVDDCLERRSASDGHYHA